MKVENLGARKCSNGCNDRRIKPQGVTTLLRSWICILELYLCFALVWGRFVIKKAWKLHSIDKSIFIWKPCNMVWYLQTEEIFQSISFQFTTTTKCYSFDFCFHLQHQNFNFQKKRLCENPFGNSKLTLEKPRHDIKKYFIPQCCELIDHDSTLAFLRSFRP